MSYTSSKLQTPSSREAPITKLQGAGSCGRGAWCLGFGVSLVLGGWCLELATAAALTPAETQFFENKIRPVLSENCYKCHSAQSEKVKAGLTVDTREGLLSGGQSGAAIVPGDPE